MIRNGFTPLTRSKFLKSNLLSFLFLVLAIVLVLPVNAFSLTYGWARIDGVNTAWVTDFNLFLTGDLFFQNSDVEGRVAVGGDAELQSFSIGLKAVPSDYSMIVGGNIKAGGPGESEGGQVENGGIQAGGGVNLSRIGVTQGDLVSGGDVRLFQSSVSAGAVRADGKVDMEHAYAKEVMAGGNVQLFESGVTGSVSSSGDIILESSVVAGFVNEGAPGMPGDEDFFDFGAVDLDAISDALWRDSDFIDLDPAFDGAFYINAGSGVNFFSLDADSIGSAWGIMINAPEDATVVINVSGETVALENMAFSVEGGIGSTNIIYNFHDADMVLMHNLGLIGSVLAPDAYVSFYSGVMEGILMADSLGLDGAMPDADGLIHSGQINMPVPVPEPEAWIIFCSGILMLFLYRRSLENPS